MFLENLKIALRAIFANKMRSILTVLGVMIGVASVIAVVSLVQGMQYKISQDLQSIGSTFIEVFPEPGDRRNPFLQKMPDLTMDDAQAVRRGTTSIREFTPIYFANAQMKYGMRGMHRRCSPSTARTRRSSTIGCSTAGSSRRSMKREKSGLP